jgi:dihydrodipicolinate synthase/N-acetylneuraminate lyase
VPVKAALTLMGILEHDAVRAPLLTLDPPARNELADTLRGLGVVERAGGRIEAPGTRAAVA